MRLATALVLLLFAAPTAAQNGDCALGTATADLDYSDVRARLYNKGNLFWDGGVQLYEVPAGEGVDALFANGIWVGGLVNGELRTAATTYTGFSDDYEFWPGPLDENGEPPEDCEPFDRIWVVNVDEVAAYEANGTTTPDLLEWPVELGAPVIDGDGIEGNYDLEAGDRPRVYGSETAFWVMNDVAGPHTTTKSEPIGLEVRATAFAMASADAVFDRATFYRYELVYRNDAPLEEAHFTLWNAPELGNWEDDYAGTDSTRNLAYIYNADNDDDEYNGGYGLNPPALGYDFLTGAGSTIWFFNSGPGQPTALPVTAEDYYHYMRGLWLDGSPLTEGGTGYNTDETTPVRFLLPGDPLPPDFWSARCPTPNCDSALYPGVRSHAISTPAFTLQPGATKTIDFAIVFAQGDDHLDSVAELKAASDAVQAAYNAGDLFDNPTPVASENPAALPGALALDAPYPNPLRSSTTVSYQLTRPADVRLSVSDVLGRRVAVLAEGRTAAGEHRTRFEADGLASGVYFVVLEADGQRAARKVMIVR